MIDTINNAFVKTYDQAGPASYAANGFLVDLTADFNWLEHVKPEIETVGSLPPCQFVVKLNQDTTGAEALGKCVIKILRKRYNKTSLGNVTGNPAGTTVQAAKAATGTTTGSGHTHAIDHDHPVEGSTTVNAGGNGVNAAALQPLISDHSHQVDVPAFVGSSTSTTHTHNRSFEYEHNHALAAGNYTETDTVLTELGVGTNISTTVLRLRVTGNV